MNVKNFLYCFDENYNFQAFTSIYSLLENVNIKVSLYLIHNLNKEAISIPNKILEHNNLESINIYKFKDSKYKFENIQNTHVSSATYYRLFLENYLPSNLENIIYLDPDTIIISDFIDKAEIYFEELNRKNILIAGKTEFYNLVENSNERFSRLNIDNRYFNAGVLFINYSKWTKENFTKKFVDKMLNLNSQIVEWDQDVMNSEINGDYVELEEKLNYIVQLKNNKFNKLKPIILHFAGSKKPWLTSGAFTKESNYYHKYFQVLYKDNYHIVHKQKLSSVKELIVSILTLKFFKINSSIKYLLEFTRSIYK